MRRGPRRAERTRLRALRTGPMVVCAIALALSACQPIVVDSQTGEVTSQAKYAVTPTRVTVGGESRPAVQVLVVDCDSLELRNGLTVHLRTTAHITDRFGNVVFANYRGTEGLTAGSSVIDSTTTSPGIIVTPVPAGAGPFTVTPVCTTYTGAGDPGVIFQWEFEPCVTQARACAVQGGGRFAQINF